MSKDEILALIYKHTCHRSMTVSEVDFEPLADDILRLSKGKEVEFE